MSRGDFADIYCSAFDPKGGTLEYMWYETPTGKLRDITAIGRGSETSDTLHCNTEQVGTRYFVCMVSTSNVGIGYSSVIPVTVTEQNAEHTHQFGEWMVTTEPTCTESGIKVRECECGYTERDGIPAAGHQWDAGMATKEPTIDTVGVKTFTCTVCGETKSVKSTDVAVDEPSGSANSPQTVLGTESTAEPAEPLAGGETQTSGLPAWSIVLVAVVAAGGGAAVTAFIVKRKNVDRAKT